MHYFIPLNTLFEKREGSGSMPLTNGSGAGSGRPKNMRIRIPNIEGYSSVLRDPILFVTEPLSFTLVSFILPIYSKYDLFTVLTCIVERICGYFYLICRKETR
jgi:hypothetical protein